MMKQFSALGLALLLALSLAILPVSAASSQSSGKTVSPTSHSMTVDGKKVSPAAYTIDGNNYFKLRDIAALLTGTKAQFQVGYDAGTRAITLTTGQPYSAVGGELSALSGGSQKAVSTPSAVYVDGKQASFTAYNVNGNNYFKLRDLGQALGFYVGWDDSTRTMVVDSTRQPEASPASDQSGQPAPAQTKDGKVHFYVKAGSGALSLRAEASGSSSLVKTVDSEYTFLVFLGRSAQGSDSDGASHTWYQVQTDDDHPSVTGWVRSDQIEEIDYDYEESDAHPIYHKFTDGGLNVRSKAGHDSALVCTVNESKAKLYPLGPVQSGKGSDGKTHEWMQISVNRDMSRVGWVRIDLTDADIMGAIGPWYGIVVKNTNGKLNVRSQPQHNSDLVASIEHSGTYLYRTDETRTGKGSDGVLHEWYCVLVPGYKIGWVRSDLVKPVN